MKKLISILLLIFIATSSLSPIAEDVRPLGDANGDGVVDQYDYLMVRRYYFGTLDIADDDLAYADVNLDTVIDQYDYILLKRHYFGSYEIVGEPIKDPDDSSDDSTEPEIPEIPITPEIPECFPEGTVALSLIPDAKTETAMKANTKALQEAVDLVSENGGGVIYVGKGTFHFASQGLNARGNEEFVCMPKDNVTIVGEGADTVFKPVGRSRGGLDMFYFNEYADSGFTNPQYLVNADFYNFTIDGELANADYYTSAGKGFMINLYKDCDWKDVIVKNTDGTGFGMDCPINCTIIDCEAYNCGKRATTANVGASGFGIGTGYAENETLLIDGCYAEGNKKFGIFFEHQGRFCGGRYYKAQAMEGFLVQNCIAKNNYIDFGGELAVDVTFKSCTVPQDSTSVKKIAFEHHSIRCYAIDMNVEASFTDASDVTGPYYEAVCWAVNKGLTTGVGNNMFGINDECSVGHVITFLYRLAGCPGELRLTGVGEAYYYENSRPWALKNELISEEISFDTTCDFATLIEILWIYDGKKEIEGDYDFPTNWAIENGIIDAPSEDILLRGDAALVLYNYFG